MYARYYNSATGRFLSPDWSAKTEPVPYAQLEDPQTLNLYQYVRNHPLNLADPDGHCCEDVKKWLGDHPRTVNAGKAVLSGVVVVAAIAAIPETGGMSLYAATMTVSAISGGLVGTVGYGTAAITGDKKMAEATGNAVNLANPLAAAAAVATGGNLKAAARVNLATDFVGGVEESLSSSATLAESKAAGSTLSPSEVAAPVAPAAALAQDAVDQVQESDSDKKP